MRAKYEPLQDYLLHRPAEVRELTLTFAQIEDILEAELPESAHQYSEWWSNDDTTHVQAKAWLSAGWEKDTVNLEEKWIRFKRS